MYNLLEKPFKKLFFEAQAQAGQTGENLVKLLERRLDNVIYRGRLTSSRRHARQLITHGFVQVNNRKVDIPSYRIKQGDVIKLIEKAKDIPIVKETLEQGHSEELPAWLELDFNKLTLTVVRLPEAEEIKVPFEPQLIVEFYSR
jgi:small subunit ribosomal protein S4